VDWLQPSPFQLSASYFGTLCGGEHTRRSTCSILPPYCKFLECFHLFGPLLIAFHHQLALSRSILPCAQLRVCTCPSHARSVHDLTQDRLGFYVFPALGLWALDRLARVIRLFAFNHSYFGLTSGIGTFNATAELIADGVVRLSFRRPSHLHWAPGQSAWLTMPSVSSFPFESHPFTIANADISHDDSATTEKMDATLSSEGKEVSFIIQARSGFTRRLAQVASTSGTLKIFFDGPYSSPPRLAYYDTVVLLAGMCVHCPSTYLHAS
jgi:hypothetical protein